MTKLVISCFVFTEPALQGRRAGEDDRDVDNEVESFIDIFLPISIGIINTFSLVTLISMVILLYSLLIYSWLNNSEKSQTVFIGKILSYHISYYLSCTYYLRRSCHTCITIDICKATDKISPANIHCSL